MVRFWCFSSEFGICRSVTFQKPKNLFFLAFLASVAPKQWLFQGARPIPRFCDIMKEPREGYQTHNFTFELNIAPQLWEDMQIQKNWHFFCIKRRIMAKLGSKVTSWKKLPDKICFNATNAKKFLADCLDLIFLSGKKKEFSTFFATFEVGFPSFCLKTQ